MKHYEAKIKTAKGTLTEKFCFAKNINDAITMIYLFMNQNYNGIKYEISSIREIDESELDFGC